MFCQDGTYVLAQKIKEIYYKLLRNSYQKEIFIPDLIKKQAI